MTTRPSLPTVCDAEATARLLGSAALMAELRRAALELEDGRIACPERLVVPMVDGASLLSMPAVAADLACHKLITVTPGNASRGLPTLRGQVSVIDPGTGATLAILDAATVTGKRTAGISLLAVECLLPRPPGCFLIVGTGHQARHHVEAVAGVFPQARIRIRGRSAASAASFVEDFGGVHPSLGVLTGPDDPDVVITCTTSPVPVYTDAARRSRLVVAVGSFTPSAAEIGAATVRGSRVVVVDDLAGARHEAGDLLQADVDWDTVRSLGSVLRHGGDTDGPMLFKSVGCAAWDLAAARLAVKGLLPGGSGQLLDAEGGDAA